MYIASYVQNCLDEIDAHKLKTRECKVTLYKIIALRKSLTQGILDTSKYSLDGYSCRALVHSTGACLSRHSCEGINLCLIDAMVMYLVVSHDIDCFVTEI